MTAATYAPVSMLPPPAAPVALYDSRSVGIATFLGSPLAGAIVMAINYKRLGQFPKALLAVVIGAVVTTIILIVSSFLPLGGATTGIAVGTLLATVAIAKALQGQTIIDHQLAGGRIGSRWIGAAIGLVFLVIILGIVATCILLAMEPTGTRYAVGQKDEIYYAGTATETNARSLGDELKKIGYFTDRGATVKVVKDAAGSTLSFTVGDGVWDKPEMVSGFEAIGRDVAPAIGGLPLKVRLLNVQGDVKKELPLK